MVNRRAKGNRTEKKLKVHFQEAGYEVCKAQRGYMYQKLDFFGVGDMICLNETDVFLVQSKTNQFRTDEKEKYDKYIRKYGHVLPLLIFIYMEKKRAWKLYNNSVKSFKWVKLKGGNMEYVKYN